MKYALIDNNVVVQIDCNPRAGFVEVDNSVYCGMLYDGVNFKLPTKSNDQLLNEGMEELNKQYDANMLSLANEYNIAVARDASTETEKVLAARSKIDALDAKYELDQANLIAKYNEA
tara:strand:+ start:181 stop:531 length:351 start_codon:yes stop_codon:yes gene_type:complete